MQQASSARITAVVIAALLAILLAWWANAPSRPLATDAPADRFSAGRQWTWCA